MMTRIATTTPTAAKVPATAPLFEKNALSVAFEAAAEFVTLAVGDDVPTAVVTTTTVDGWPSAPVVVKVLEDVAVVGVAEVAGAVVEVSVVLELVVLVLVEEVTGVVLELDEVVFVAVLELLVEVDVVEVEEEVVVLLEVVVVEEELVVVLD